MNGNQSGGQSIPTHGLFLQTGFQIENFPSWDRTDLLILRVDLSHW